MIAIAITPKRVHVTRFHSGRGIGHTKTYSNISQYSRNRAYAIAKKNATRATVNLNGSTTYYIG